MTVFRNENQFVEVMGLVVAAIQQEFDAKLARLESAMQEFRYCGTWIDGRVYKRGNFVTLGAVWHCNDTTLSRPGTNNDWALAVPKPRDGRDGKDATAEAPAETPERRTVRSRR